MAGPEETVDADIKTVEYFIQNNAFHIHNCKKVGFNSGIFSYNVHVYIIKYLILYLSWVSTVNYNMLYMHISRSSNLSQAASEPKLGYPKKEYISCSIC